MNKLKGNIYIKDKFLLYRPAVIILIAIFSLGYSFPKIIFGFPVTNTISSEVSGMIQIQGTSLHEFPSRTKLITVSPEDEKLTMCDFGLKRLNSFPHFLTLIADKAPVSLEFYDIAMQIGNKPYKEPSSLMRAKYCTLLI